MRQPQGHPSSSCGGRALRLNPRADDHMRMIAPAPLSLLVALMAVLQAKASPHASQRDGKSKSSPLDRAMAADHKRMDRSLGPWDGAILSFGRATSVGNGPRRPAFVPFAQHLE